MPILNLQPDIEAAEEFVEFFAGDSSLDFRTFDDSDDSRFGARKYSGSLSSCASALKHDNQKGAGIFFVVNETDGKGQFDSNIKGIRALFVDLDGSPIEPCLQNPECLPHIVVESSPSKYHCYWLIQKGLTTQDFRRYQVALANKFNGDSTVVNASRVLRLPGFYHQKNPSSPFMTKVLQYNHGPLFDPKDIADQFKLDLDANYNFGDNIVELFPNKKPDQTGFIPDGARDVTLFKIGSHLRHAGMEFDEIHKHISRVNATRCNPPLSDGQVKKIAQSIAKKESVVINFLQKHCEQSERESVKEKFGIISFEELETIEVEPIKWIIPDLLPQGLTILAGNPKLGKSWLAQELSYAVATGGLALDRFPTIQGNVLHLALEDPIGRFAERYKSIKKKTGITPRAGHFTNQWKTIKQHGLDHLKQWINEAENPKLIIIDTLQKFRGVGDDEGNIYARDYRDMAKIQALSIEFGIGILVVHHLNKTVHTDPMARISGSQGVAGAADLVWLFDRKSRDVMNATLRSMGRDTPDAKYALNWNQEFSCWSCKGFTVDEDKNTTSSKILELLKDNETRSFTSSEIADKIGRSRPHTFQELVSLTKDELVIKFEQKGTSFYSLNRALLGSAIETNEEISLQDDDYSEYSSQFEHEGFELS